MSTIKLQNIPPLSPIVFLHLAFIDFLPCYYLPDFQLK